MRLGCGGGPAGALAGFGDDMAGGVQRGSDVTPACVSGGDQPSKGAGGRGG